MLPKTSFDDLFAEQLLREVDSEIARAAPSHGSSDKGSDETIRFIQRIWHGWLRAEARVRFLHLLGGYNKRDNIESDDCETLDSEREESASPVDAAPGQNHGDSQSVLLCLVRRLPGMSLHDTAAQNRDDAPSLSSLPKVLLLGFFMPLARLLTCCTGEDKAAAELCVGSNLHVLRCLFGTPCTQPDAAHHCCIPFPVTHWFEQQAVKCLRRFLLGCLNQDHSLFNDAHSSLLFRALLAVLEVWYIPRCIQLLDCLVVEPDGTNRPTVRVEGYPRVNLQECSLAPTGQADHGAGEGLVEGTLLLACARMHSDVVSAGSNPGTGERVLLLPPFSSVIRVPGDELFHWENCHRHSAFCRLIANAITDADVDAVYESIRHAGAGSQSHEGAPALMEKVDILAALRSVGSLLSEAFLSAGASKDCEEVLLLLTFMFESCRAAALETFIIDQSCGIGTGNGDSIVLSLASDPAPSHWALLLSRCPESFPTIPTFWVRKETDGEVPEGDLDERRHIESDEGASSHSDTGSSPYALDDPSPTPHVDYYLHSLLSGTDIPDQTLEKLESAKTFTSSVRVALGLLLQLPPRLPRPSFPLQLSANDSVAHEQDGTGSIAEVVLHLLYPEIAGSATRQGLDTGRPAAVRTISGATLRCLLLDYTFTRATVEWARSVFDSRAFHLSFPVQGSAAPSPGITRLCLSPIADMINHSSERADVIVRRIASAAESAERSGLEYSDDYDYYLKASMASSLGGLSQHCGAGLPGEVGDMILELGGAAYTARRSPQDRELLMSYGPLQTWELLMSYGFSSAGVPLAQWRSSDVHAVIGAPGDSRRIMQYLLNETMTRSRHRDDTFPFVLIELPGDDGGNRIIALTVNSHDRLPIPIDYSFEGGDGDDHDGDYYYNLKRRAAVERHGIKIGGGVGLGLHCYRQIYSDGKLIIMDANYADEDAFSYKAMHPQLSGSDTIQPGDEVSLRPAVLVPPALLALLRLHCASIDDFDRVVEDPFAPCPTRETELEVLATMEQLLTKMGEELDSLIENDNCTEPWEGAAAAHAIRFHGLSIAADLDRITELRQQLEFPPAGTGTGEDDGDQCDSAADRKHRLLNELNALLVRLPLKIMVRGGIQWCVEARHVCEGVSMARSYNKKLD